ncbi:pyruvate kinase [Microbispora bryophytorum]|uniref:pyruvate kinase n=1 Tax=Microbispora bryophytorum TaxID=1460882 RepID=UPI0033D0D76E
MSRTRVIATIGPATRSAETLARLARAGMNLVRLNASHNTLDWHRDTIALVRRVLPAAPILLDVPGRKIRTANLASEPVFGVGDTIILTTQTGDDGGRKVPISSRRLHLDVSAGDTLLADDGKLRFTVVDVRGPDLHCRAEVAGRLRSRKGINAPGVDLGGELVGERDREMLAFARETGVDLVGISFVESAGHVGLVRKELSGGHAGIVAKIETPRAVRNLEEIIDSADAIMIDRGDLSIETDVKQIGLLQKEILARSAEFDKPVIVATEMLDSMIERPYPTKAEILDITNAVLAGAAGVMLSGETAVGAHPVESVRTMKQVASAAEEYLRKAEASGDAGPAPAHVLTVRFAGGSAADPAGRQR